MGENVFACVCVCVFHAELVFLKTSLCNSGVHRSESLTRFQHLSQIMFSLFALFSQDPLRLWRVQSQPSHCTAGTRRHHFVSHCRKPNQYLPRGKDFYVALKLWRGACNDGWCDVSGRQQAPLKPATLRLRGECSKINYSLHSSSLLRLQSLNEHKLNVSRDVGFN